MPGGHELSGIEMPCCCAGSAGRVGAGSIAVENANDASEVAYNKPEAQAKGIK